MVKTYARNSDTTYDTVEYLELISWNFYRKGTPVIYALAFSNVLAVPLNDLNILTIWNAGILSAIGIKEKEKLKQNPLI